MLIALVASLVNPLVFCAAMIVLSFSLAGEGLFIGQMVAGALVVLVFPVCSAVGASALYRWIFPAQRADSISLISGLTVMAVQLSSDPFLTFVSRVFGGSGGGQPLEVFLPMLIEGGLIATLVVSSIILAVLCFELPCRIFTKTLASFEPESATTVIRLCLSGWLLVAGAALVNDVVERRLSGLCSALVGYCNGR